MRKQVMAKGLTGMWIDNNEMAGMVDDEARFAGQLGLYNARTPTRISENVEKRAGWGGGQTTVGQVGKAIQTMGMARVSEGSLSKAPCPVTDA